MICIFRLLRWKPVWRAKWAWAGGGMPGSEGGGLQGAASTSSARNVPFSNTGFGCIFLKGPRLEILGSRVFTQIKSVWVGDFVTRPKNSKFWWFRLENRHFILFSTVGAGVKNEVLSAAAVKNCKRFRRQHLEYLKVVDNEKWKGLRGWLLVEGDTGPWRSMSVYFLM